LAAPAFKGRESISITAEVVFYAQETVEQEKRLSEQESKTAYREGPFSGM
jgi:hypothetical protein